MTRLETQIEKLENELKAMKEFSAAKLAEFNALVPAIMEILKPYKVKTLDTDNCFYERTSVNNEPIFRMYAKLDTTLTERQAKNVTTKLRELVAQTNSGLWMDAYNGDTINFYAQ